jgi:hypothetical protein
MDKKRIGSATTDTTNNLLTHLTCSLGQANNSMPDEWDGFDVTQPPLEQQVLWAPDIMAIVHLALAHDQSVRGCTQLGACLGVPLLY